MAIRKHKPIEEHDPQAAMIMDAFDRLHGIITEEIPTDPAGRATEKLPPQNMVFASGCSMPIAVEESDRRFWIVEARQK